MAPSGLHSSSSLEQNGLNSPLATGSDTASKQVDVAELNATNIKITLTSSPKPVPQSGSQEQRSQKVCSDHMVSAAWTSDKGWARPEIKPYGPLQLMPTANVLHYATECFEGRKLYRGLDKKLRLFRPLNNCIRMVNSAQRISLPIFDPHALLTMIRALCALDGPKWLPKNQVGNFLYVRPALIGTDPCLGHEVPQEALLFVVINELRAWPGGTGDAKIGPNYGPSRLTHGGAKQNGYDQVLWLLGDDSVITEAGSSNVFIIRRTPDTKLQLITAPLGKRTVLAGVTRQSILDLAKTKFAKAQLVTPDQGDPQLFEELEVLEQDYTMHQLCTDLQNDDLLAVSVVGTAAFVSAVALINYRGQKIQLPTDRTPHLAFFRRYLYNVMYGLKSSDWVEVVEERELPDDLSETLGGKGGIVA